MCRSRATRPRRSRSIARATSIISSTKSPAPTALPLSPRTGRARRRWRSGWSTRSRPIERALSLGAEPADIPPAQKTLDVPAIKGIGGSLLYFVDRYGAKGSAYDAEFEWLGAKNPRPEGAGLYYHRSPHPQRPSRPHGCLDRLLRKTVQLPADPLFRYRGPRLRPVLAGADQPRRQDPDSDQRGRRRFRPDRGISQRLSRRGHPAHRLRRQGYLPHGRNPARRRPAVHAVTARRPISRRSTRGCPGMARTSRG